MTNFQEIVFCSCEGERCVALPDVFVFVFHPIAIDHKKKENVLFVTSEQAERRFS